MTVLDILERGVFHQSETAPVKATIIGEMKNSPIVLTMFERLTSFNRGLNNKGNGLMYVVTISATYPAKRV